MLFIHTQTKKNCFEVGMTWTKIEREKTAKREKEYKFERPKKVAIAQQQQQQQRNIESNRMTKTRRHMMINVNATKMLLLSSVVSMYVFCEKAARTRRRPTTASKKKKNVQMLYGLWMRVYVRVCACAWMFQSAKSGAYSMIVKNITTVSCNRLKWWPVNIGERRKKNTHTRGLAEL